jgi:hypothetical protein
MLGVDSGETADRLFACSDVPDADAAVPRPCHSALNSSSLGMWP